MDKLLLKIIAVHPLGQRVHTGETNDLRGWHTIGNWRETGTEHLKQEQIEAHMLPTAEAVHLYNELAEKKPVAIDAPFFFLQPARPNGINQHASVIGLGRLIVNAFESNAHVQLSQLKLQPVVRHMNNKYVAAKKLCSASTRSDPETSAVLVAKTLRWPR